MEVVEEEPLLRIQFASDIHLEFPRALDNFPTALESRGGVDGGEIPVVGDCLALLGDIGYPKKKNGLKEFLYEQAERFSHTFLLAGNHEFYSLSKSGLPITYQECRRLLDQMCKDAPGKTTFLDRTSVLLKGVRILGVTLWSNVPDHCREAVENGITDYKMIVVEDEGGTHRCTVEDTNTFHAEEVAWLEEQIKKAKEAGDPVVVMSHHAPTMHRTSHPSHTGSQMQHGFATELSARFFKRPVVAWLFGHTHYNDQHIYKNKDDPEGPWEVLVASNQTGYFAKGNWAPKFDAAAVVEVYPTSAKWKSAKK